MFKNSNLLLAKNFTLNSNSKDVEVSFSRISPIILPYFINNKYMNHHFFTLLVHFGICRVILTLMFSMIVNVLTGLWSKMNVFARSQHFHHRQTVLAWEVLIPSLKFDLKTCFLLQQQLLSSDEVSLCLHRF